MSKYKEVLHYTNVSKDNYLIKKNIQVLIKLTRSIYDPCIRICLFLYLFENRHF